MKMKEFGPPGVGGGGGGGGASLASPLDPPMPTSYLVEIKLKEIGPEGV